MKVAIVDYGLGNLFSINNVLLKFGVQPIITSDWKELESSDALILPGVGAFGDAMNELKRIRLVDFLTNYALSGRPFMGICLGMQLLFTESEEFGLHKGLNIIEGKVTRFPDFKDEKSKLKIPQIQWNKITSAGNDWSKSPLKNIPNNSYMHFVHSYFVTPSDTDFILSRTEYGIVEYPSSVIKGNIFGVQFHPEKSAELGLSIYQNWLKQINHGEKHV